MSLGRVLLGSARSKWARIAAIQRNQAFEAEYKHARALWAAGLPAVFPPGTFWLARHARVTVRSTDGAGTSMTLASMVT